MTQAGSEHSKKWIHYVVLALTAILIGAFSTVMYPAAVRHPFVTYDTKLISTASKEFSSEQIGGAFSTIKNTMYQSGFNGCTLNSLEYNEKKSDYFRASDKKYSPYPGLARTVYIFVDFTCNATGYGGSLERGHNSFNCSVRFDGMESRNPNDWNVLGCGNG